MSQGPLLGSPTASVQNRSSAATVLLYLFSLISLPPSSRRWRAESGSFVSVAPGCGHRGWDQREVSHSLLGWCCVLWGQRSSGPECDASWYWVPWVCCMHPSSPDPSGSSAEQIIILYQSQWCDRMLNLGFGVVGFLICLFGCIGSQLWNAGSLLHHWGSSDAAQGLSSYGTKAAEHGLSGYGSCA